MTLFISVPLENIKLQQVIFYVGANMNHFFILTLEQHLFLKVKSSLYFVQMSHLHQNKLKTQMVNV